MKYFQFKHADTPLRTLRNSASLIVGTAASQLVIAASIPIVTRLYTVSELGTSAVLISIFSTLSIVGCLRYEIAIPLPSEFKDADVLARVSVFFSTVFAILICGLLYLYILLYEPDFADITPTGLFVGATYFHATSLMSIGNMASIRDERYHRVSRARLLVVVTQVPIQLVLGLMGANTFGLMAGFAAANYAAAIYLLAGWFRGHAGTGSRPREVRRVLNTYRGYPIHTSLASLLNTLCLEAPLLYFGIRYSTSRAGYVGMVQMGVAVPLALISTSIGLAIYGEWGKDKLLTVEQKVLLRNQTRWIIKRVALAAAIYLLLVILLSRLLATTLLGAEWYHLWAYALAIGPFYAASAVSSPTGWLLELFSRTRLILARSIIRFLLVAVTILVLEVFKPSTLKAAMTLSVYGVIASITFVFFSTKPLREISET